MRRVLTLGLTVAIATLAAGASPAEAQFGARKTKVTLNRLRPPKVYLIGTAIQVQCLSQSPELRQAASRLQVMLEAEITGHDPRLRPVSTQPDTLITCTVGRIESSRNIENRVVAVPKQTGTKRVYNAKKNAYEDQAVYGVVNETHQFLNVRASISVVMQVREPKTSTVLDADTLDWQYSRDFPNGVNAPDPGVVEQELLRAVVNAVVPRVTPTREPIEVLLAKPNDEIEELNKLGVANLWGRMLERLELVKPLKDTKKDAYRLYNLGVASEALAYQSEDSAVSKQLIAQASSYYGKAIDGKFDEKYFQEPQTRITESIAAYAKFDAQKEAYARALSAAATSREVSSKPEPANRPGAGSASAQLSVPPPVTGKFSNADVIDLVERGLDQENLLGAISDAKAIQFDFSPDGLRALLDHKVPNAVITAMRTKARAAGPKPPVSAPRGPADAPKPPLKAPGRGGAAAAPRLPLE